MENEEGIDFNKLEKEFNRAVEADAKYQRENAAKFRAVEQRVGSYEEFKDIVAASHLKPLEKKDRLDQVKIKQPWNTLASGQNKSDVSTPTSSSVKTKSSQQTLTSHTFTKTWKYELKTSQERYIYLCKTGGNDIGQIFKSEIPMGLFGEFMQVLHENFQVHDCDNIVDILWHLSTTKRFTLTVEFLSSKEKDLLKKIFRKFEEVPTDECPSKDEGDDRLKELATIYKVEL